MRKIITIVFILIAATGLIGWFLSAPSFISPSAFANITGNTTQGEQVFYASGCASCHAAPKATGEAKKILSGGKHFKSDFGTFFAPNISPDPDFGIGKWTMLDFANAVQKGTSPSGQHYYPAFPYTSYSRMTSQDVADLFVYMKTLPKVQTPNQSHHLGFPFNIRRGLGLWKLLFASQNPDLSLSNDPEVQRGRYLVEGPGHCGECHTQRNPIGGLNYDRWLAGGPSPEGTGKIPNITSGETGINSWAKADIEAYLKTGFTPDFDTAGGSMVDVIDNTSHLSDSDIKAIAKYLKAIPAK